MQVYTFALVRGIDPLLTTLKNPGAMVMARVFGHSLIIRVGPKFMTKKLIQSILTFITDVVLILILLDLIGRLSSYPLSFVFKTTHFYRLFYKLI